MKLNIETSYGDYTITLLLSSDYPRSVICDLYIKTYDEYRIEFTEKRLISGSARHDKVPLMERLKRVFGPTRHEMAIENMLKLNNFDEDMIKEFKEVYWAAVFAKTFGNDDKTND
jgi:hypothetical protein